MDRRLRTRCQTDVRSWRLSGDLGEGRALPVLRPPALDLMRSASSPLSTTPSTTARISVACVRANTGLRSSQPRFFTYTRPDVALRSLEALRPHLTRPLAELDAEDVDPDLATPYAELERDYFRLVLEAHLTWLVRAEKRLKGMDSRSRRTKGASRKRR